MSTSTTPLSLFSNTVRAVGFMLMIVGTHQLSAAETTLTLRSTNRVNVFDDHQPATFAPTCVAPRPTTVTWTVRAIDRPWKRTATTTMPTQGELLLQPPTEGHGLYELIVESDNDRNAVGTTFATVFTPPSATRDSRWGIFTINHNDLARAPEMARGQRVLGASWSRYKFWQDAWRDVQPQADGTVTFTIAERYVAGVKALHGEGMHLMGEIYGMPLALSSKPAGAHLSIEGAPIWERVPPTDWRHWESLIEQAVRSLPEIEAWEIWNEPDVRNFWLGTVEEFAELISHTAGAIKRANPQATVVASGITGHGSDFVTRLLELGADRQVDVWSVHADTALAKILRQHGVTKPIWETEVHALFDADSINGFAKNFHFLQRAFAPFYEDFPALYDRAGLPTSAACTYSLQVHLLGNDATLSDHRSEAGYELSRWRKADGELLLWRAVAANLLDGALVVRLRGTATQYDACGREIPLPTPAADGTITLPISSFHALSGMQSVEIVRVVPPHERPDPQQVMVNAQSLAVAPGWTKLAADEGFEPKNAAHQPSLFLNQKTPGAWPLELPFTVDQAGTYTLLFLGLSPGTLEADIRWSSPWSWAIDDGPQTIVERTLPAYRRFSSATFLKNQKLNLEEAKFTGNGDAYHELGEVTLTAGTHVWHMKITAPRPGDGMSVTNVEGIVLRPRVALAGKPEPLADGTSVGGISTHIESANAGFEFPPLSDADRFTPRGLRRDGGSTTYCGPYPAHSGKRAFLLYPAAGAAQTIYTVVPTRDLTPALKVGDQMIITVWLRHYWEENGARPTRIALGLAADDDRLSPGNPLHADTTTLERDWRQVRYTYRIQAADLARAPAFWKFAVRSFGGSLLIDDVDIQIGH